MIIVATSTLGMAAYNALAVQPRPMNSKELLFVVKQMMQHEVDEEQLDAAILRLVKLGRITMPDHDGYYKLVAVRPLVVIDRDRSDAATGDGGWKGWLVKDPTMRGAGARPLEEIIAGGLEPAELEAAP